MFTMTPNDARQLVRNSRFGILSLAHDGEAYGLPLFYGYDGHAVYFHTLPGAKLDYIDATRQACFTISVVHNVDEWSSVQIFGRIERIDGTPSELAGLHALMVVPLPPEFGLTEQGEPARAQKGMIYRLDIARMSGRFSARVKQPDRADDMLTRGV